MRHGSHHARHAVLLGLIFAGLASAPGAEPSAPPALTRVEQIRALSFAQAAKGYPVHLKGVITYIFPPAYMAFLADRTGGVYVAVQPTDLPGVVSGDEVELDGKVAAGASSSVVKEPRIKKLGHLQLPPGTPIGMRELADGTYDAQRVEIEGVVRSADPDTGQFRGPKLYSIKVGVEDRSVRFHAPDVPGGWNRLIDSTVRVSGVMGFSVNGEILLYSELPSDVKVERLGAQDPFSAPLIPIAELPHIGPGRDFTHRLRIRGVVLYAQPHRFFFVFENGAAVRVLTRQAGDLHAGDLVEATGFCDSSQRHSGMVDAQFRKIGSASLPAPTPLNGLAWIPSEIDGTLVEVHGKITSYGKERNAEVVTLEEQGIVYQAYLPLLPVGPRLAGLPVGSNVELRGVARLNNEELSQNQSLDILLRSLADVTVLNQGSWIGFQRLIVVASWLCLLVVVAAILLFLQRRKVKKQTAIIAQSYRKESALERRYLKLVESATDIIFSVSPEGSIFRPNAAASAVFGSLSGTGPDRLGSLNLLDVVRPSTRETTHLWLRMSFAQRFAQPIDLQVMNCRGGESVLEVSASPVEDVGDARLMECIARDVTQRKKEQQLEVDRNRVLEMVARRSPLDQILPVVENLLERQIPNVQCSIVAVPPLLGAEGLVTGAQPQAARPRPGLETWEGRDLGNRVEIRASDDSPLGWLCYASGDSGPFEADQQVAFDTAVNLAAVAIEHDLLNRKLIHQSQHDALTGLPNRLLFQDRLAQDLLRAHRQGKSVAVMYLDLDRFKFVNDQLGHDAGDLLLVEVSRRLAAQLRETDSLARMGGDEFTLVVPDLSSRQDAEQVAAKLVAALRPPFLIAGIEIFTGASVGISMYPEDSEDPSKLQGQADMAMYSAKSQGKSRYQFYRDMPAPAVVFGP